MALEPRLERLRRLATSHPGDVLVELSELRRASTSEIGGSLRLEALFDCVEARAELQRGELRRSLEAATRAERAAAAVGAADVVGGARHLRAQVFGRLGHHGASLAAYDDAIAILAEVDPVTALGTRIDRAGQLRASGRLAEAATAFDALVHDPTVAPGARVVVEINAASCWHQVGRVEDAAAALRRSESGLSDPSRADLRPWWHTIAAWVDARSGRPTSAAVHVHEALAGSAPDDLLLRSSATQALGLAATLPGARPELVLEARAGLERMAVATVERGLLAAACDIQEALADLATATNDPVVTVRHLRERERLLERQRAQDDLLRLEAEDMRLELVRFELEAERLRAGSQALQDANRALEDTDLARRQLLQSVAHDLRGLVHAFLIGTELIDPADPDQVRELRRELHDAAGRMQALVDRTLSDDSIRTGVPQLIREPVDLTATLPVLLRSFGPLARAGGRSLRLQVPPLVRVSCDPVALARIVDNLVGNALKYSPTGGTVTVAAEQDEGGVQIRVEDDGPGFPTTDPQRALVLGERLGASGSGPTPARPVRGIAGRGIGLHVVYDLVSRLGGVVEIGNRPEGGARVVVRLP